jgi:hypothetical protein
MGLSPLFLSGCRVDTDGRRAAAAGKRAVPAAEGLLPAAKGLLPPAKGQQSLAFHGQSSTMAAFEHNETATRFAWRTP